MRFRVPASRSFAVCPDASGMYCSARSRPAARQSAHRAHRDRVRPSSTQREPQRCRPVLHIRRTSGLKVVNTDFFWLMGVPAGLREQGRHVPHRALGLPVEDLLSPASRVLVERLAAVAAAGEASFSRRIQTELPKSDFREPATCRRRSVSCHPHQPDRTIPLTGAKAAKATKKTRSKLFKVCG